MAYNFGIIDPQGVEFATQVEYLKSIKSLGFSNKVNIISNCK